MTVPWFPLGGCLRGRKGRAPDYETTGRRGPTSLEDFDAYVERSRLFLEAAHAAFDAWQEDNPEDETE